MKPQTAAKADMAYTDISSEDRLVRHHTFHVLREKCFVPLIAQILRIV